MSEIGTSGLLPAVPEFEAFYEAVNGRVPFPWQRRLAQAVASAAQWPEDVEEIGIPTGLGKTACLDIAIWWLASQAHLPAADRTAPTRIWWVVNRRLLVDSTFDHAKNIGTMLSNAVDGSRDVSAVPDALYAIARRLRSLAVDFQAEPLEVIRLRGGAAWGRPTDPSQPAVILSTIPMYGSRLLFRGYGSSRSMRPVDAALAGTDSLVLVDEAHLADHLVRLFPALQECAPWRRCVLNPLRAAPNVVALTATGTAERERFELDEADEANPEITRRLDAAKPTKIWVSDRPDQVAQLADAAASLLDEAGKPATCVIFVNAPSTARAVRDRLPKAVKSNLDRDDIVVLTGQTREREARIARNRILNGMRSGRIVERRSRHLLVVATQTLEVGADIDAEFLVTEACGVRALTQRLGRMNRLGRHQNARAIYVHCPPPLRQAEAGWPVYGKEPHLVLERLQQAAENGVVDLSPRRVAVVLGKPDDGPGRAPEILPALLWEWVKTTIPPTGEAPVEPYFSGIAQRDLSVSVMWRVHVPKEGEDRRLWPRPMEKEFLDVTLSAFREAVKDDEQLLRIQSDGVTVEATRPSALRPGDQVVLRADQGLLDADGWAPGTSSPVADLSILHQGLPLEVEALRRLCDDPTRDDGDRLPIEELHRLIQTATGEVENDVELDNSEQEDALGNLLEILREYPPPALKDDDYVDADLTGGWTEFISQLERRLPPGGARLEVPHLRRSKELRTSRIDEHDEMSLAETAMDLDVHGSDVGTRAGRVAAVLGLPPDLVAAIEQAGSFHDVGKADHRFQRWLAPDGTAPRPLAKSAMPRNRWASARTVSGWPAGGRHEDLSARLVREWLIKSDRHFEDAMADLLVHLVISHHGKGRPLVPPAADDGATLVEYQLDGIQVSASADLSEIDWTQPSRFKRLNELYGPWGLALLEAIVRQADHAVSAGAGVRELEVL